MASDDQSRPAARFPSQRGYILLSLMLFFALLAITALAIAPSITFQVQRDREEEMIHRGVQYSRAVRRYFKKFGRYPTRIEDLENTNNLRFLRKRYKDPITRQDFKLLHFGDVKLTMGAGIAGAATIAAGVGGGPAGTTSAVQRAPTGGMLGPSARRKALPAQIRRTRPQTPPLPLTPPRPARTRPARATSRPLRSSEAAPSSVWPAPARRRVSASSTRRITTISGSSSMIPPPTVAAC
jgi:type II secretory pathway pseudopilin PulG